MEREGQALLPESREIQLMWVNNNQLEFWVGKCHFGVESVIFHCSDYLWEERESMAWDKWLSLECLALPGKCEMWHSLCFPKSCDTPRRPPAPPHRKSDISTMGKLLVLSQEFRIQPCSHRSVGTQNLGWKEP